MPMRHRDCLVFITSNRSQICTQTQKHERPELPNHSPLKVMWWVSWRRRSHEKHLPPEHLRPECVCLWVMLYDYITAESHRFLNNLITLKLCSDWLASTVLHKKPKTVQAETPLITSFLCEWAGLLSAEYIVNALVTSQKHWIQSRLFLQPSFHKWTFSYCFSKVRKITRQSVKVRQLIMFLHKTVKLMLRCEKSLKLWVLHEASSALSSFLFLFICLLKPPPDQTKK